MEEGFKVPDFPSKLPKTDEKTDEEINSELKPEIPYKIPKWDGAKPAKSYSFEVLKNGVIVETVKNLQERSFWLFGRLPVGPTVNISAAHPTISRFHAVLQYKNSEPDSEAQTEIESGWFVFDLGKFQLSSSI